MAAGREFKRISVMEEKSHFPRTGYVISCSKCTATERFVANTNSGMMAPEVIARAFRVKGWHVSNSQKKDLCPKCCNGKDLNRENVVMMNREDTAPQALLGKIVETAAADPPRQMGREDRRIIFAKLNEVYIDESKGYSAPWNDARVAADLNVPKAWVKDVRDQNFGPEGLSEEAREVVKAVHTMQAELTDLANEMIDLTRQVKVLESKFSEFGKRLTTVSAQVNAIERNGK